MIVTEGKVIIWSLIRLEAYSTRRIRAWCYKTHQKLMTGKARGPRELTVVVLINVHIAELPSKCLHVYPQINSVFNLNQRSFFLQWEAVNAKIHN